MAKKKCSIGNRHDAKGHKVHTNAHAKGSLKISVHKPEGRKRKGSKKTILK